MGQKYSYSISNDTSNGQLNSGVLTSEIDSSSITGAVVMNIGTHEDTVEITFDVALSAPHQSELTGVLAAHVGVTTTDKSRSGASEGNSETTSTEFQTKVVVTTDPVSAGSYFMTWYCELRVLNGSLGDSCEARAQLDAMDAGQSSNHAPEWTSFSGLAIGTYNDGDTPSFNIAYRVAGAGGDTAAIRRARVIIAPLNE